MIHKMALMRRPKKQTKHGTAPAAWPEVKELFVALRTTGSRQYEQVRKQFASATAMVEAHFDKDIRETDVLYDKRRQKRFEILGLIDVDNEGVLYRIPVTELV